MSGSVRRTLLLVCAGLAAASASAFAGGAGERGSVALTVATVNNPDMVVMQRLSGEFSAATGIHLDFVVLPENELRQRVTEDAGLGSGR
jgi:polyol transport system substrate-binding protein